MNPLRVIKQSISFLHMEGKFVGVVTPINCSFVLT